MHKNRQFSVNICSDTVLRLFVYLKTFIFILKVNYFESQRFRHLSIRLKRIYVFLLFSSHFQIFLNGILLKKSLPSKCIISGLNRIGGILLTWPDDTRNKNLIHQVAHRINARAPSIRVDGVKIWDAPPTAIQNSPTFQIFKKM